MKNFLNLSRLSVLMLLMTLLLTTAFTSPVLKESSPHDWVYELVKPQIKDVKDLKRVQGDPGLASAFYDCNGGGGVLTLNGNGVAGTPYARPIVVQIDWRLSDGRIFTNIQYSSYPAASTPNGNVGWAAIYYTGWLYCEATFVGADIRWHYN